MADNSDNAQQIMETARKLGDLVASHPAVKKYAEAQQALGRDQDAARLLQEFERKMTVLVRNEQMGQPVTAAERQELETLQASIASNIRVKAFSIAQTELTDLLRKVSQAWQKPVAEAQGGEGPAKPPEEGTRLSMG